MATGTTIDLAPLSVLIQRDGLEAAVRTSMAELLVFRTLAGRPVWVTVGAGRYFGRSQAAVGSAAKVRCPSDAELTLAVSATAQREAESRAEACFARALAQSGDWREVR